MENASTTTVILHVTYLYLLVLVLALLIERILEVLMASFEFLEYKCNWQEYWIRRARKIRNALEKKLHASQRTQSDSHKGILYLMREKLLGSKKGFSGLIPTISPKLVRHVVIAMVSRIVATIFGCLLCIFMKIDLVEIFNWDLRINFLGSLPGWLTLIVSGIIIGLGSEPVHNLIEAVEKRRKKKEAAAQKELSVQSTGR